jgi:crotonobetainyl-CoA:carnitine CoA-transferase CaiB-like acyl-CoA transferase
MTSPPATGSSPAAKAALSGLKVVEFAQLVAGPLVGTLLADLGADVIHVEDPGHGDPGRRTGMAKDGTYLWWKVLGRNKRSVTLDLRRPEGQDVARRFAAWADVVITNMRPGTLDSWGLNWPALHAVNPKLVMLQVSGYGASTTLRNAPGYGKVGEARSGVVQITGFPDGPPVHTGFSHADTVTALMGAFAVQAAVYRQATDPQFDGEWVDLAVDEALFRLIEWQVVHFDQLGVVAERIGNGIPGAPNAVVNAFQSGDGRWITVTSGTLRSIQNIAALVGMAPEKFAHEELVGPNRPELEKRLAEWMSDRPTADCLAAMELAEVVASPVLSVADIAADRTYAERGNIVTVDDPDVGPLRMQGVIPRLHNHRGDIWRQAPALGQHNDEVYSGELKLTAAELSQLRARGVIGR